jgi:hypothetical protein
MAAASCGHVRPRGPSLPCWDDFVGQVRVVLVQPSAQHRQHRHATAYKESATAATHEIERLRHESAILCSGARPPSEQDHKL